MDAWKAMTARQRWQLGSLVHMVFMVSAYGVASLVGNFWGGLAAGVLIGTATAWIGSSILAGQGPEAKS